MLFKTFTIIFENDLHCMIFCNYGRPPFWHDHLTLTPNCEIKARNEFRVPKNIWLDVFYENPLKNVPHVHFHYSIQRSYWITEAAILTLSLNPYARWWNECQERILRPPKHMIRCISRYSYETFTTRAFSLQHMSAILDYVGRHFDIFT